MNHPHDPLDALLGKVPRDVEPSRDLWPQIRQQIDGAHSNGRRWQLAAAAAMLVVTTASLTFFITKQSLAPNQLISQAAIQLDLGEDYQRTRDELQRQFNERVASLPPATQLKLKESLAELQRASDEIAATLAKHPTDPLLQELLVSTQQRELQLLAEATLLGAQIS